MQQSDQPPEQQTNSPKKEEGSQMSTNFTKLGEILGQFDGESSKNYLKGCIDALITFDELKREQTHYRNIIRESYSKLFKENSILLNSLFMQGFYHEMGMRMKLVDLEEEGLQDTDLLNSIESNPDNKWTDIHLDKENAYVILQGDVYVRYNQEFIERLDTFEAAPVP